MKKLVLILLCLPFGLSAQEEGFKMDQKDVSSIDGLIEALYDVISGPAGEPRNWDRFRGLFTKDANLCALGKDKEGKIRYRSMSVEDYVKGPGEYLIKNGFFEVELSRERDEFGLVTQLFSTYESRSKKEGPVIARGINSIQIAFFDDRYWLVNILWNAESPDNPIPQQYLK